MQQVSGQFENLAKTTLVAAGPHVQRPPAAVGFTLVGGEGFIPLEGVIDRDAELDRQQQEAEKLSGFISSHEQKLSNKNFVDRAPQQVVNDVRQTLAEQKQKLAGVEAIINELTAD